jgi:hypothetical protein
MWISERGKAAGASLLSGCLESGNVPWLLQLCTRVGCCEEALCGTVPTLGFRGSGIGQE